MFVNGQGSDEELILVGEVVQKKVQRFILRELIILRPQIKQDDDIVTAKIYLYEIVFHSEILEISMVGLETFRSLTLPRHENHEFV